MSSKNFYGLTGDVTIDGGILNVANTNVSGNVTSTSLLVSNVATLGTTKTFVVTVDNSKYVIDGDSQASLELHEGQTYIFDITAPNASNPAHPFKLSQSQEHPGAVYQNGVEGYNTNYIKFTVPFGAPTTLYYYCQSHTGMGGQINISPTAELVVSGRIVASGNVEASKITASANVEVTGNVVASKFVGDGSLLTNVTGATTSGLQTVTDNSPTTTNTIQFTNPTTSLTASSNIVATGNVTADHFIGDGSQLSGIVTSVTFGDAVDTGNISSNTLLLTNAKEGLVATGNVVTQGKFIGDGSKLTGIVTSVNLSDAVNTGNTTSNTVQFTNVFTSLTASGNVEVTGNVIAGYFIGDGSRLTNLPGGSGGSGTSHWSKTSGTNELHYSAGSVGISNTTPVHDLSVGSNLYIDDDASDGILMVTGNVHGTYFVGDGSRLINLPEGGGSTNWTTSGSPVNKIYYPQNPGTTSVSVGIMNAAPAHTLSVGSNLFVDDTGSNVLVVDGDITAESMFLGALGIKPSYPLDTVTDVGNVTPHTISFTNPTLGITTASNVEIGGALVVGKGTLGGSNLEVGEANLFVNTQLTRVGIATDQPAATLHVNGSLAVDGPLTFGTVDVAAQHGLEAITAVNNTTPLTVELQNADTSLVTTGNVEVGGNVITSKDLMVTGNVTTNSELIVAGNVFYTNLTSVSVKSNVVTEYTGPHDRPLRKYPEIILPRSAVGAEYNGYRIDRSSEHVVSGSYDGVHDLFNETAVNNLDTWGAGWQGTSGAYSTSTGEHSTYVTGGTTQGTGARLASNVPNGEWVSLKTPNAIKLDNIKIRSRNANDWYGQFPTDFQIWGSNDGTTWSHVKTFTGQAAAARSTLHTYIVNSAIFYNRHALVVTKIPGTASTIVVSTGHAHFSISELRFNANEEGGGSLDTTLKSVFNVPATTGTQLEVYYDGQNYTSGTTVNDLSPNTNNGTLNSGVGFDSTYKAFTFDGTDDYIRATIPGVSGDYIHSISMWVKFTAMNDMVLEISGPTRQTNSVIGVYIDGDGTLAYFFYDNDARYHTNLLVNQWYHIGLTYSGSGKRNVYINGIEPRFKTSYGDLTQPLTLAGGTLTIGNTIDLGANAFNGSIANFRFYSKVLSADQIKELYDYQKDYFLGSKSQVTLYKGHLGVGVTEPSGQLELAGDERIQEYPPMAMTGWETYMEGHGVFRAGKSGHDAYLGTWDRWKVFNKGFTASGGTTGDAYHGEQSYSSSTGLYTGSESLGGISGDYFILDMPYKISLKHINVTSANQNRSPTEFIILGSNNGSTWTQIKSFSSSFTSAGQTLPFQVNSTEYFSYFGLVVTKIVASDGYFMLSEWQLFGTPDSTTLDKGSLSLTRSLDVPRVSRYDVDTETPRPEKLILDLDTTVNSSATDISGQGNHGAFEGNAKYSVPDKAFTGATPSSGFAAYSNYIKGSLSGISGAYAHTQSYWVNGVDGTSRAAFTVGVETGNYSFANLYWDTTNGPGGRWVLNSDGAASATWVQPIEDGKWYHVVLTYDGGSSNTSWKFYLDGEYQTPTTMTGITPLALPSNPEYRIGRNNGTQWYNGMVSNIKVYSVALEPSEVKKLYNMGRTGRSMVISDTAVGIGRAPEAQLDVRGTLAVRGRVGVGTSSPNAELHVVGASGQLSSAQHYGFASGGPAQDYNVGIHNTVSIYGNDDIVAGGYVLSHAGTMGSSDERIKKEIVDVEDGEALSTLRLLKPKQYKYRDDVKRGTEPVWGFIAQEVSATLPYATQLRRETVPNIYELANVSDSNVITFTNFDTSNLESNVFNIKVFDTENNEHMVNLTEVINERSIRVNKDLSNWTANVMTGNQIFVYGQQVDDFTFLKKDAIWTVATAALQEVDRQLQNEKLRNDTLETQVSDLLERVTALENA